MEFESNATGEFKALSAGREVARLNVDGTHWIADDITDEEVRNVFPHLVRVAANLNKLVLDCKAQHQS